MIGWADQLRRDPLAPLLIADDPALRWSARHDLLGEEGDPTVLWELPAVTGALRRQRADGSWKYPGGRIEIRSRHDYDLLASYEALLPLVYQYRLDVRHPAIGRAADFLLGFQTEEGDLRGIYGSQYSPNYTAAILAILIEAGYLGDPRVKRGMQWLLPIRQDDGGWTVPWRTRGAARSHAAHHEAFQARRLPRSPRRELLKSSAIRSAGPTSSPRWTPSPSSASVPIARTSQQLRDRKGVPPPPILQRT